MPFPEESLVYDYQLEDGGVSHTTKDDDDDDDDKNTKKKVNQLMIHIYYECYTCTVRVTFVFFI